jgi:hypothetical protein
MKKKIDYFSKWYVPVKFWGSQDQTNQRKEVYNRLKDGMLLKITIRLR